MALTTNPVTGQSHSATGPMWIFIVLAIIAFVGGFLEKLTGIPHGECWAIAGSFVVSATGNALSMAMKKNGVIPPAPPNGG